MKNVLTLLIGFTFTIGSGLQAVAGPGATLPSSGDQDWETRSLQLSCYYTDALRLSISQASAVRQATRHELQQLNALEEAIGHPQETAKPLPYTTAQVLEQYDAAMLRILTPGQYSAFHLLQQKQPSEKQLSPNHVAQK